MAVFVALSAFRTPEMFANIQRGTSDLTRLVFQFQAEHTEYMAEDLARQSGKSVDEHRAEAESIAAFAQRGEFEINTDPEWALSLSIQMGLEMVPHLERRTWWVITAPERSSFVVSDCPVVVTSGLDRPHRLFGGTGFGSTDAVILFPLGHRHLLVMLGVTPDLVFRGPCDQAFVRQTNLLLARHCKRFLVGRAEPLLRSVKSAAGLASQPWKPRMRMAEQGR